MIHMFAQEIFVTIKTVGKIVAANNTYCICFLATVMKLCTITLDQRYKLFYMYLDCFDHNRECLSNIVPSVDRKVKNKCAPYYCHVCMYVLRKDHKTVKDYDIYKARSKFFQIIL